MGTGALTDGVPFCVDLPKIFNDSRGASSSGPVKDSDELGPHLKTLDTIISHLRHSDTVAVSVFVESIKDMVAGRNDPASF